MIQSVMLVVLGFLLASLLALFIAPAFWARAVKLTTERLRNALPLTEAEINADRDQLRAQYAIKVHQLQKAVDEAKLNAARQLIELNRRDANIGRLQEEVVRLQSDLEENQNARRVLEQTLSDRLPKVEARLREARQLLEARDEEIARLGRSANAQERALAEAKAIHAQQQAEIQRLKAALTAHQARGRRGLHQPAFESEIAMRAEVETLRAKTREQTGLIERLQRELAEAHNQSKAGAARKRGPARRAARAAGAPRGTSAAANGTPDAGDGAHAEGQPAGDNAALRHLEALNEDQAAEIARLKAELASLEASQKGRKAGAIRETKAGLKAKLEALDVKAARQMETINRLRSELAAANDRAARQAAYFMNEMRRIGATTGGQPAGAQGVAERGTTPSHESGAPSPSPSPSKSKSGAAGGARAGVAERARILGGRQGADAARTNGSTGRGRRGAAAFGRRLLGGQAPADDARGREEDEARSKPEPTAASPVASTPADGPPAADEGGDGKKPLVDRLKRLEKT